MNKWQEWHDSLSPSTKQYLVDQAIWRDIDLFKFTAIAFVAGFLLGLIL
jgi:hypothetical protein